MIKYQLTQEPLQTGPHPQVQKCRAVAVVEAVVHAQHVSAKPANIFYIRVISLKGSFYPSNIVLHFYIDLPLLNELIISLVF